MWERLKPLLIGLGVGAALQSLGLLLVFLFKIQLMLPLFGLPFWVFTFSAMFIVYLLSAIATGFEAGRDGTLYGAMLGLIWTIPTAGLLGAMQYSQLWIFPLAMGVGALGGYLGQMLARQQALRNAS